MLVFGDRIRTAPPTERLEGLAVELAAIALMAPSIERHGRLVGALIEAGRLWQGLADAEVEAEGRDHASPLQQAAAEATLGIANAAWRSWRHGREEAGPRLLHRLCAMALPTEIRLKTPEGYAFYALYPETYGEAAETSARRPARMIGLRSIGTSLAAMAAAAVGAPAPVTLRPAGPPFRRQLRLAPELRSTLAAGGGDLVVVDEGPGLSGSSFGAVGDLLTGAGVAEDRLLFLPSHGGEPGPEASLAHRERWRRARRGLRTFDDAVSPRLVGWVSDLTGPPIAPLEDLSGGGWREGLAPRPPSWTGQERRKFRLTSTRGAFLLKFIGLGDVGRAKLARGYALADAGFCPKPLGWRHGFLVEPWMAGRPLAPSFSDRQTLTERLGAYIAFRVHAFPADTQDGASLDQLAEMARHNLTEGLGAAAAVLHTRLANLRAAAPSPRPLRSDNRMHAWEWLAAPDGRLIKTDALDHDDTHDLVGCQDPAWDVAGAEAAFDLDTEESARLLSVLARAGVEVDATLLEFMRLAYAAFQLGYWTLAAAQTVGEDALNAREARRWATRLAGGRPPADRPREGPSGVRWR